MSARTTIRPIDQAAIARDAVDVIADRLDLPLDGDEPIGDLAVRCRDTVQQLVPDAAPQPTTRAFRRAEVVRAAKKAAEEQRRVLLPWELGKVVQDRWGLRWRGDLRMGGGVWHGEGWVCRSGGLRVWRTTEQMLDERGPLTPVRVDVVFGTPEQHAARLAGEADDATVVVDPVAAEDAP